MVLLLRVVKYERTIGGNRRHWKLLRPDCTYSSDPMNANISLRRRIEYSESYDAKVEGKTGLRKDYRYRVCVDRYRAAVTQTLVTSETAEKPSKRNTYAAATLQCSETVAGDAVRSCSSDVSVVADFSNNVSEGFAALLRAAVFFGYSRRTR